MITNILLGLILITLCAIAFMVFAIGRIIDERRCKCIQKNEYGKIKNIS